MPKTASAAVFFIALLVAAAVPGCSQPRRADTDRHFVTLYAELMLLNEKEKSAPAVSDSVYALHALDLLTKHGMSNAEFKNRSDELMKDDRAWRDFLGQVSLAFDSIKTARALPPKHMPR